MTITSRSIILQIVWRHIAALAVVALAVSIAAHHLLSASVDELIGNMLRDRAAEVAGYISAPDGRWAVALPAELQAAYAGRNGGIFVAFENEAGETVYSTFPDANTPAKPAPREPGLFKEDRASGSYFALVVPIERGGYEGWLKVARHLDDPEVVVDDVASHFYARIFFVVLPIILLLLLVDIAIIHRALAPVRVASGIASSITPNTLDVRLPIATMPDEIRPLAAAVNAALERLEHAFRHQRDFTADAAHELRTPLTVLRTHMDLLPPNSEARELRPDVMAMCRIVDQLLELADLEAFTLSPDDRVDLRAVCEDVVGAMAPAALMQRKQIGFTAPDQPVWIPGNPEMVARAVRNLVDNAIRHAPAQSSVEVEVSGDEISDHGEVSVADSGPGVAPPQRELIFQRFWRGDRRDKTHSGIGLSIVAQVAKLHDGTVSVDERPGGGALFRIRFPRARFQPR